MQATRDEQEQHDDRGASSIDRRAAKPLASSLESGLRDIFGHDQFRPGQQDVMEAVLRGINSLVVMPTGSGKSLCYQLPACVLDGITLVISPLIALMKDQVDGLLAKGIPTTFINSSISTREQRDRLFNMEMGQYKVVYIAPERFRSQAFCDAIANTKIGLLAIDEAHCISQWGHDFRPDYLRLAQIRDQLNHPPTIALTATATRQVQRDILAQLNLPEAEIFVYGFERPNLFFEVYDTRSKGDKLERIQALMSHLDGEPMLIYCATRRQVEEVSKDLEKLGIEAGVYHGGLSDNERAQVQDSFMNDDFRVLIATNAFGMGVDKSNIRGIVHFNHPGSIEAYYQEAGRAGRDLEPSHCLLLFNYADRGIHEFFNEQTFPTQATVERVWDYVSGLGMDTHNLGAEQIADQLNRNKRGKRLNSWGVETAMRQLARAGHIEFGTRDGYPWVAVQDLARTRDLRVDWDYLDQRRAINEGLLADVIRFASGRTCRQLYLLRYFNSRPSFERGCGHCDVCCGTPKYAKAALKTTTTHIVSHDPVDTLLQKLLSGVARAKGRYGAHIVAGALRGSSSKKVSKTWLVKLSTYGLLSYLKQPDIVFLLDLCLRHNLLNRDQHGCISLSEDGKAVMKNPDDMNEDLREHLDAVIIERGTRRKRSRATPITSKDPSIPGPTGDPTDGYAYTQELLERGYSLEKIAVARGVQKPTILRHLLVLADRGDSFDLSAMIDPTIMERVRQAAEGWTYGEALGPVKRAARCSYDDLKIHLAQVLMDRKSST